MLSCTLNSGCYEYIRVAITVVGTSYVLDKQTVTIILYWIKYSSFRYFQSNIFNLMVKSNIRVYL